MRCSASALVAMVAAAAHRYVIQRIGTFSVQVQEMQ
jgi:hypothetical protein